MLPRLPLEVFNTHKDKTLHRNSRAGVRAHPFYGSQAVLRRYTRFRHSLPTLWQTESGISDMWKMILRLGSRFRNFRHWEIPSPEIPIVQHFVILDFVSLTHTMSERERPERGSLSVSESYSCISHVHVSIPPLLPKHPILNRPDPSHTAQQTKRPHLHNRPKTRQNTIKSITFGIGCCGGRGCEF